LITEIADANIVFRRLRWASPMAAPLRSLVRPDRLVARVPIPKDVLMTDATPKPFLIAKDETGQVRLTVREIRHNSQGYPLVTKKLVDECFKTSAAARAYAVEEFGAKPGEFSTR
jgi:hypothetical protein